MPIVVDLIEGDLKDLSNHEDLAPKVEVDHKDVDVLSDDNHLFGVKPHTKDCN